jgi:hypothetical protein
MIPSAFRLLLRASFLLPVESGGGAPQRNLSRISLRAGQ